MGCFVSHGPALRLKLILLDSGWNDQTRAPGNLELGLSVSWPLTMSDSHVQPSVPRLPVSEQERHPRAAVIWGGGCPLSRPQPSPPVWRIYTHIQSALRIVGFASSDSANHGLKIFETKVTLLLTHTK